MKELVLGIDIGGTNTKYGLVKPCGELLFANKFQTDSSRPFIDFCKELHSHVERALVSLGSSYRISGVGVGAPNANPLNGKIENPHNLKWGSVELVKDLEQIFKVPIKFNNDANVAAVGEKKFGKAKNLSDFMVITLGTGVGTGTYINNQLFEGHTGIGSEAGHITIVPNGRPCGCLGRGHLETYLSSKGIKQTIKESLHKDLRFREIKALYLSGNKEIVEAINTCAHQLAFGLSLMSSVMCPEAFIITGGISTLGAEFVKQVEINYEKLVYTPFKNKTKFYLSNISTENGAILGAAALVLA